MMTVKEISKLTGISVRTLHYYDEIGLLKPTSKSPTGYRLYNGKALETLQQILFFREFDIPLKKIKAVINDPVLDKNQILHMQREMLLSKKAHIEQLLTNIDAILKGENSMNFAIFNKTELEDMYHSMIVNMNQAQKEIFIEKYGSIEAFHKHFIENASSEAAQKNFQKITEWYGDKEHALEAATSPDTSQLLPAYQRRLEAILNKLAVKKNCDVHSFEVKELIGEYDFIFKQLYQMNDVSSLLLETAKLYQTNEELQKIQDSVYGSGTTEFFGRAIEAFYRKV